MLVPFLAYVWNVCSFQSGQRSRYHCGCLAHDAPLSEAWLLCAAKALHVLCLVWTMKRKFQEIQQVFMLNCLYFGLLSCYKMSTKRSRHLVSTSFTWLVMPMWVFAMISCWECIFLVWALDGLVYSCLGDSWLGVCSCGDIFTHC